METNRTMVTEATGTAGRGTKRFIAVDSETREVLVKVFGVTPQTVYNALHYASKGRNSETARRIRKAALERGGVEMTVAPTVQTLHDWDGHMRQYLPNGVLLDFDKQTGGCTVYRRGEAVARYETVGVMDIERLQVEWGAQERA